MKGKGKCDCKPKLKTTAKAAPKGTKGVKSTPKPAAKPSKGRKVVD